MFNPLRLTTGRIGTAAGGRLLTSMRGGLSTSAGGRPAQKLQVQEGEFTTTIYSLLAEQKYEQVRDILLNQMDFFPNSRAALSLLGYCHYMLQDFESACTCYEQLMKLYPEVEQYKIYYAQSLFKAGLYPESIKSCSGIDTAEHGTRLEKLQASCQYEQDELVAARAHLQKCVADDPDVLVTEGCILYKEGRFDEAARKFTDAMNITGYQSHIAYNIALCNYCLKRYTISLRFMQEIIERGIQEHPELSVGSNTDGFEVRSVGNSQTLRNTALIEAFNLKCAIYFQMKNYETALESLKYMPPRQESELDAVTLHNQALLEMDANPTAGFKKLRYLLQKPPFPPETFANLLILYCKHQYYYLAADILAENPHLSFKYLSQDLYDFLEAIIESQTSPEEAFRKFDMLATKHIDVLRSLTSKIHTARQSANNNVNSDVVRDALREYEEALESYIPILMAMAKIYWDIENFPKVEEILKQNIEFCEENPVWKLNMAHTCFMSEKFKEAIDFYKPIVDKQKDALLEVPAMVLANLCVAYIMTSQNEEAEEWMRNIEREEDALVRSMPDKQSLHLCVVNLVIGTLYCSKGHYEFGISRIIKSLEPYNKKIMVDTWFYAKRCFLSLVETLAKHMIIIKDDTYTDILNFLDQAITYGKNIITNKEQILQAKISNQHNNINGELDSPIAPTTSHGVGSSVRFAINTVQEGGNAFEEPEKRTTADEARMLKRIFLQIQS